MPDSTFFCSRRRNESWFRTLKGGESKVAEVASISFHSPTKRGVVFSHSEKRWTDPFVAGGGERNAIKERTRLGFIWTCSDSVVGAYRSPRLQWHRLMWHPAYSDSFCQSHLLKSVTVSRYLFGLDDDLPGVDHDGELEGDKAEAMGDDVEGKRCNSQLHYTWHLFSEVGKLKSWQTLMWIWCVRITW